MFHHQIQLLLTVILTMDRIATQITESGVINQIIFIFVQQVIKSIFSQLLIASPQMDKLVYKIKDKFAILQAVLALIGAIL
jgi:hypothetical protein